MHSEISDLLLRLAVQLEQKMVEVGSNPRDPQEVESFINGCGLSKKIKKLIIEELDDE